MNAPSRLWPVLFVLVCLGCIPALVQADERILDFHSEIQVFPDAGMIVEETIRVRAEGRDIRRGIYRDFPTRYRDGYGNRVKVGFELLGVERDGRSESYHTETLSNGIRIYMGRSDTLLPSGEYRYRLRYRTTRQLGFFKDHDELYWNVTGNGWSFPIDRASARVRLPEGIAPSTVTLEAYTGAQGTKGRDYRADIGADGNAFFETIRKLGRQEGLTIVVGWPKGHVIEPDLETRTRWFFDDNRQLLIGLAGLVILTGYYLVVWSRVGRDPEAGVIVPEYGPPPGYSPAAMRYIRRMGYDDKAFAASLISLAARGFLTIDKDADGYRLQRTDKTGGITRGEAALTKALFRHSDSIALKQSNHSRVSAAIGAHKSSLKRDYEKLYFLTNRGYLFPGILISLALIAAALLGGASNTEDMGAAAFITVWLAGWTAGVVLLVSMALKAWRARLAGGSTMAAITSTGFALPFIAFEGMGLWFAREAGALGIVAIVVVVIAVNVVFYQLLKAPTRAGRKLLDKIEGFRRYLDVAERDELAFRHPPKRTPSLFEAYLPYALALDVEQAWAKQFADVLAGMGEDGGPPYRPGWYHGRDWDTGNPAGSLASFGSALSGAVSAASTAPGSSSGGGGGGSSGGGGGGGGGGGW